MLYSKKKKAVCLVLIIFTILLIMLVASACSISVKFKLKFVVEGEVYATINTNGYEQISLPSNPKKSGYIFDGWYWDEGVWEQPFTANSLLDAPLSSDMSVYAKFTNNEEKYSSAFLRLSNNIKNNCTSQTTLKDAISYIYASAQVIEIDGFTHTLNLTYGDMFEGDDVIYANLVCKMGGEYFGTISMLLTQTLQNTFEVTYTHYDTKSEGTFYIAPNNYYSNSNITFAEFEWGQGLNFSPSDALKYRSYFENYATYIMSQAIIAIDNHFNSFTSFGIEKLGFINAKNEKTYDKISNIFCNDSEVLKLGKTRKLNYTLYPFFNKGDEIITSSNSSIVSVKNKNVTGEKLGETTLTIISGTISRKIQVTVEPVTNADNVKDFFIENNLSMFDSEGNRLNNIPLTGTPFYTLSWVENNFGEKSYLISCNYNSSYYSRLAPTSCLIGFNINDNSNVLTQLYNTATGVYRYYKYDYLSDTDVVNSICNIREISDNLLNFNYAKTDFMKSLNSKDLTSTINNMQSTIKQTIDVLELILTSNSNAYLDSRKPPIFNLSTNQVESNYAKFNCSYTNYYGEKISEVKLYSNGVFVRDCIDEFVKNYSLNNLIHNTNYELKITFTYDKFDGAGTQLVERSITFKTKITNGTPYIITLSDYDGVIKYQVLYNQEYSLPKPTRLGYNFTGWYLNNSVFQSSGTWTRDENITLVAHWSAINYSITYSNMSGATSSNPKSYNTEQSITLKAPSKTGYTFLGWTNENITEPQKAVTISKGSIGNLSFKANWIANEYTITFDVNGGDNQVPSQIVTYDKPYTLPQVTRVGYDFVGWYNNNTLVQSSGTWKFDSNKTLTARWNAKPTTHYIVNHYQQNVNDDNYTLFETANFTGISDSTITPAVKSYTGFTAPSVQTVVIFADGSLVVNYYYTRNIYNISFVSNGGTIIDNVSYKFEADLNLQIPTRSYYLETSWISVKYSFDAWYKDINLTTVVDNKMPASNMTLYASWAEETKPSQFSYQINNNSVEITAYNGNDINVVIPEFIGGNSVTIIGNNAFKNKSNINSIAMPEKIKTIGDYAFSNCSSANYIGYMPFDIKGIIERKGIVLPENLNIIGDYAFENVNKVTNISVPNSVRIIGEGAFKGCNTIVDISLPFVGRELNCGEYYSVFGYIFGYTRVIDYSKSKTYESCSKTSSGSTCQYIKDTKSTNDIYYYDIPKSIKSITITSQLFVPKYAFVNCNLIENVTISENTTSIGSYSFSYCQSLKRLNSEVDDKFNIPIGVEYIGANTFSYCTNLTQLNSDNANEINIPDNVKSIGENAFKNVSNVTKIIVSDSVTSIAWAAFKGCTSLEELVLPFVGNSINSDNGHKRVFGYIFGSESDELGEYSTMAEYLMSSGKTSQGYNTDQYNNKYFYYYTIPTSIRRVTITKQTYIPSAAFRNCNLIKNITLTNNTSQVALDAVDNCNKLTDIYYTGNMADWCESELGKLLSSNRTLYINGKELAGEIVIPNGVKNIKSLVFNYRGNITNIIIPNSVTNIGSYAFSGCSGLTTITIPDSLTSIGNGAFSGCSGLTSITLPFVGGSRKTSTNTYQYPFGHIFGTNSYDGGVSTTQYYYGADTTKTTSTTYYIPSGLKEVTITGGNILHGAFYNCNRLANIILPSSITSIEYGAFYYCTSLTSIIIPDNITSIGNYAFVGCSNLTNVIIPNSVNSIGASTFDGCSNLTIYCEIVEKPDGWADNWNPLNRPVEWGYIKTNSTI